MDNPLRLALFDFDGTLCDSATTIVRLMKAACMQCDVPIPDEKRIRGNIGYGINHSTLSYTDGDPEKGALLADTYRRLSVEEYLGGNPPLDPLFDGVKEMLAELTAKQYLTGIITNKSRSGLDSLISRHGLDKVLDITLTADDCMVKPAPDMAQKAMRQLGVMREDTILVGDTEIDAGCAANAQIGFVGVGWGYHSPELLSQKGAVKILSSFSELPSFVEAYFS